MHGNFYGSPRSLVEATLQRGKDVIFDIDYQGTQQVREKAPNDVVTIFILPPSVETLWKRLESRGTEPKEVFVDLGYRGVDHENPGVTIHHRGKHRSMTQEQRRWLKRRQSIEPVFGHLKNDHRMDRNWLKGEIGDAIHAVLCAAGYNIRWLMRAIIAGIISPVYLSLMLGHWMQMIKERFVGFLTGSTMDLEMDLRLA